MIKNLDIFGIQFSFTFQNKNARKTLLGGSLSIAIISIALLYFIYLIHRW